MQNLTAAKSAEQLLEEGRDFTLAQAKKAERCLLTDPFNVHSRIQLIGYYAVFRGKRTFLSRAMNYTRHLSWMIKNHPAEKILADCTARTNSAPFSKVKSLWQNAIASNPNNLAILTNAAGSLTISWPKTAEKYYLRAIELDPGNAWYYEQLVDVWFFHARLQEYQDPEKYLSLAKRGIRIAIEVTPRLMQNEQGRCGNQSLIDLRYCCAYMALQCGFFGEAKYFGDCIIQCNFAPAGNKKRKMLDADLARAAYCLIGKAVLFQGDALQSAVCLMEMAKLGEPFELSLAQELLNRREKSAVLDYLAAVRKTLKDELDKLTTNTSGSIAKRTANAKDMEVVQSQIIKISNWESAILNGKKPKFRMTVSGYLY